MGRRRPDLRRPAGDEVTLVRLTVRLRGAWKALSGWLASWKLSVALMLLAALCYISRVILSDSSPSSAVDAAAAPLACWLIHLMLLLNAGFCLWRRLPLLGRDIGARPFAGRCAHRWELKVSVPVDASTTSAMLRRLGYRIERCDDGSYWGLRRRWSALGSFLSHAALYLIASGLLITSATRHETAVLVTADETFTRDPAQPLTPPITLRELRFRIEEITRAARPDRPRVTALEAELSLPDGGRFTTRVNRPRWLSTGTFIRLSDAGYKTRYELIDRTGRTIDHAEVKLHPLRADARDSFELLRARYLVFIDVLPESPGEGDLTHPALRTEVYHGALKLAEGLLPPGVGIEVEGLTLRSSKLRSWGELSIVRDPGAPPFLFGLLVAVSGLLLRVRGRRAEILLSPPDESGRCTLRGFGDSPLPALGVGRGGIG